MLPAAITMSGKELTVGERLFGKKKTMKERSKEWQKELRKQQRSIESQIRAIEREENKVPSQTQTVAFCMGRTAVFALSRTQP